jgi:lipopolysaccharide biosynthesis regulator YciM
VYEGDNFCGYCGFAQNLEDKNHQATQKELKVNHIRFKLAVVYLKKKEYMKAIEMFEKIESDEPANIEVKKKLKKARELYRLSENELVRE